MTLRTKETTTEVRLVNTTAIEYDSQLGQRIQIELPAGTILHIPIGWIYNGVPSSRISVRMRQMNRMLTHKWLNIDSLEQTALKIKGDRDRLLVVAKRVLAELDNIYDVDQEIGNDCMHTKEFPFSGSGELMTLLRTAIEKAEAQ